MQEPTEPTVERETLRRMMQDFDIMPLTESELDAAVPIVQAYARAARRFDGMDLSGVVSGRIIALYPEVKDNGR